MSMEEDWQNNILYVKFGKHMFTFLSGTYFSIEISELSNMGKSSFSCYSLNKIIVTRNYNDLVRHFNKQND